MSRRAAESDIVGLLQHRLILLRHGETEWSKSGKHTGRTELELTDHGREQAAAAAETITQLRLENPFVVSSPRMRARTTAELAGLSIDEVNPLISEWDYGDYEGTTTEEIRKAVPNWLVWTHGCPGGETTAQVCERADRAIAFALEHMQTRDVVFVGHGHFSRAVADEHHVAGLHVLEREGDGAVGALAACAVVSPPGQPWVHTSQFGTALRISSVVVPS